MYTTMDSGSVTALLEDTGSLPFEQLSNPGNHSAWRRFMAERIAAELDYEAYGIRKVFLIGSVETGEANIGSDIDLIVYMEDSLPKQRALQRWLDVWSRSLALTNYLRTGYLSDGLLDVHIVTDAEIRRQDSFAVQMCDPAASSCLTGRS